MYSLPMWFYLLFAAMFGAVFGSFLNVVIYRVPAGESLMGRSHCPKCGTQIRERDNLPVLGWIILKGKCRDCKASISTRYPAVEAFTMLTFIAVTYWQEGLTWILPILLFYACISIALAMIDIDTMRLPDVIVVPATIVILVGLVLVSVATGDWDALTRGIVSGGIMTAFYGLIWWLSGGRGLGFGDVKMAFMLGIITGYFSWESAIVALIAAWMLGGTFALIGLVTRKMKRGAHVPFGPFLIVGSWVGIFWGAWFVNWYLTTTGIIT